MQCHLKYARHLNSCLRSPHRPDNISCILPVINIHFIFHHYSRRYVNPYITFHTFTDYFKLAVITYVSEVPSAFHCRRNILSISLVYYRKQFFAGKNYFFASSTCRWHVKLYSLNVQRKISEMEKKISVTDLVGVVGFYVGKFHAWSAAKFAHGNKIAIYFNFLIISKHEHTIYAGNGYFKSGVIGVYCV